MRNIDSIIKDIELKKKPAVSHLTARNAAGMVIKDLNINPLLYFYYWSLRDGVCCLFFICAV
jgi:hypothetical protein